VSGPLLSAQQVADLDHGTEVEITWSGGNGPHRYRVHQSLGDTFAVPLREWDAGESGRLWLYNPITFIGAEQFHTRVRTVDPSYSAVGGES
jgi:hypothetical protein